MNLLICKQDPKDGHFCLTGRNKPLSLLHMHDSLEGLRTLINAAHPLPEADWLAFSAVWKPFSARRKEVITSAGETERYLYYVLEGVQRVYYYDQQQREATLVFTYAPSFGGVLDSFLLQQPSRYYYETLSRSRFYRAPFSDLNHLSQQYPNIELVIRQGLSSTLSGIMERLTELQRSPHILQLVSHKYLANYLGIDATNFSKHLNKIKI